MESARSPLLPTLLVSALALIPAMQCSLSLSFTSPATLHLSQPDNVVSSTALSATEVSWLASLASAFVVVGTLSSSILVDRIGRKKSLCVGVAMQALAWASLHVHLRYETLLLNRVLCGLSSGIVYPCSITYLSDLSSPSFRGPLSVLTILVDNASWMASLLMASLMSFEDLVNFNSMPVLVFMVLGHLLPESPVHLVNCNRLNEAHTLLMRLRGGETSQVMLEIKTLMDTKTNREEKKGWPLNTAFLKPFVLMAFLVVAQTWIGVDLISYYGLEIMGSLQLPIDKYVVALFMQLELTLGYLMAIPLTARVPRRLQLMLTLAMCTMATTATAWSLHDHEPQTPCTMKTLMLPLSLLLLPMFYSLGVGPVTYSLLSELFPISYKGLASGLVLSIKYGSQFVLLKSFPTLRECLGLSSVLYFEVGVGIVSCILVFIFLPETLNKNCDQIAEAFHNFTFFNMSSCNRRADKVDSKTNIYVVAKEKMLSLSHDKSHVTCINMEKNDDLSHNLHSN